MSELYKKIGMLVIQIFLSVLTIYFMFLSLIAKTQLDKIEYMLSFMFCMLLINKFEPK